MIVPPQRPNSIVVNAEIKETTSVVHILGHASEEEAKQIAAYLYLELEKIKRSIDPAKELVDTALGYYDEL